METADDPFWSQVVILTHKSFQECLILILGSEGLEIDADGPTTLMA